MQKITRIIVVIGVILSIAACSSNNAISTQDTSSMETSIDIDPNTEQTDENLASSSADPSAEEAAASAVDIKEDTSDYDWDTADEITVILADNAISSDSSAVTANGSTVTIDTPGSYRISGSLSN